MRIAAERLVGRRSESTHEGRLVPSTRSITGTTSSGTAHEDDLRARRVRVDDVENATKPSSHAARQLQWVVICLQERRSKPRFKIEDRLVHRLGRSRWVEILTYVSDLSVLGDQKHHVLLTINPASRFDQRFRFDLNDRS